jgi:hypothetical protein
MKKTFSLMLLIVAKSAIAQTADVTAQPRSQPGPLGPVRPNVLVALRGGPALVGGDVTDSARAKFGGAFGLDAGVRLFRHAYAGLALDIVMMSTHETLSPAVQDDIVGVGFGPMIGWYTRPETIGGVLQLGAGGRLFSLSNQTGTSRTHGSFEGRAMLGVTFPIGALRLVVPRLDFAGGGAGSLAHAVLSLGLSAAYEHDLGRPRRAD